MKPVIYVQILGHEYPVDASAGDELSVNRLARYVEERMQEIKADTLIVDSYKLAVMAALNIADDLFRLQEEQEQLTRGVTQRADELIQQIDSAVS
ncbi:MAG: cell division protein ZapA [Elusimicrobia bacterium]|nr:cell division protein ZapA [Elusimicrobiota bacterium]